MITTSTIFRLILIDDNYVPPTDGFLKNIFLQLSNNIEILNIFLTFLQGSFWRTLFRSLPWYFGTSWKVS